MQNFQPDPQDNEVQYICCQCVGDHILAGEVRHTREIHPCAYCERTQLAVPLGEIAMRIHEVMTAQFELTPNDPVDVEEFIDLAMGRDWERKGDPASVVIADIAGLDQQIADNVANWLSKSFGWREARHGDEDPYGSEAHYEQMNPDTGPFKNGWDNFRSEIETHARFFGAYTETTLSEIFADLKTLRTFAGKPVVQEIGPQDDRRFVYRGRKALSTDELYKILKSPAAELGPPPPQFAAAGRMNSAGVSVFYGAHDRKICVGEVRPPVGSRVVTGKFELIKTVRLLDLDLLEQVFVETSHFDERYSDHYGRYAFLRQLVAEVTAPVMPQDETKEYLATQVIADFLAFKVNPRMDGIIFRSSQTDGNGQNMVLFNHACDVEPILVPPGTTHDVSMPSTDDYSGFGDEDVLIFESLDPEPINQPLTETSDDDDTRPDQRDERARGGITPTLRFHQDTMVVHEIKKMDPEYNDLPVRRVPAGDDNSFGDF